VAAVCIHSVTTRNNLISKLTGSSWGAKANILQTSASAVCYSVAECCWLVWSRSSHINLTDCQLNSTRWLISGCLHPTQTQWLPVLANIPPANLHRKSAVDKKMLCKIDNRQDWPVHADVFFTHPSQRLSSQHPIWLDLSPVDMNSQYKEDWPSASVTNCAIVEEPTSKQPGFNLPHCSRSLLNRFHTGQGTCKAFMYKWGLTKSPICSCGDPHTMDHIVISCPVTKFEGSLMILYGDEDNAVNWLNSVVTTALTE